MLTASERKIRRRKALHLRGTGGSGLLGGGVGVVVGLVLLGGDVAHDDLSNRWW
jgi:hypothetical protein